MDLSNNPNLVFEGVQADENRGPEVSKMPNIAHFDMLRTCMRGALQDGDQFDRRQALSILNGMLALLIESPKVG